MGVNLQLNKETGAFQPGTECAMCPSNRRPPPGETCCNEDTVGRPICVEYINNNGQWMTDFENAFYKMIDNPGADLTAAVAAPVTATSTEAPSPATEAPAPQTPTPATTTTTTNGGRGGRRGDAKVLNSLQKVLGNINDVMEEIRKIKTE